MSPTNFVCSSNDVIHLKIVKNREDLTKDDSFKPAFTHQVFGDEESIFGYSGLDVSLIYSASKLNCLISIKYDKVVDSEDGQKPEDIYKKLTAYIRHPVYSNPDLFIAELDRDHEFKPMGSLVKSFTLNVQNKTRTFDVFLCDYNTEGFLDYLQHLETFLIWFIDAASYIDSSDPRWQFFVLYEKVPCTDGKMQFRYCFVGYISLYLYYAYPDLVRPRISQVLILPPFQNKGLCAYLLNSFYDHYIGQSNIRDITVEAPNREFQSVRDYVDCSRCAVLPSFSKDNLIKGYSKAMADEAREKIKLTAKQVQRVYDILYLKDIIGGDEEKYSYFMEQMKKRLILKSHFLNGDCSEGAVQARKKKIIPSTFELSEEAEAEIYEDVKETLFQYKNVIRRLVKTPFEF